MFHNMDPSVKISESKMFKSTRACPSPSSLIIAVRVQVLQL